MTHLIFVQPKSMKEGLARLLAAILYRENPAIRFTEIVAVEDEIRSLRKWCRKALTEPSRATQENAKAVRAAGDVKSVGGVAGVGIPSKDQQP